jgi:hypothetical protein
MLAPTGPLVQDLYPNQPLRPEQVRAAAPEFLEDIRVYPTRPVGKPGPAARP